LATVRFGLIGCGAIHGTHAQALANIEGAKLEALYDTDHEKACAAAEKLGVPVKKSLGKLFDSVDAVCLCVPSGLHSKIGIQAAKAGKHVVCEKPIDVSLKAAQSLVETARSAGVKLTVISQHRFANDIRRLRETVQTGGLGKLIEGDAYIKWYRTQAYYDSAAWRGTWALDGGGCLMNQGVHYVDMIQWIMGGVKSVQAMTRTVAHSIEVEDVAASLVEFKNGAIGVIQGSTSFFPGLAERLEVHGTYGSVVLEGDRSKVWQIDPDAANDGSPYGRGVSAQPTPNVHSHGQSASAGGASDPSALWTEQHRLQLEDFTRAVQDEREPFISGEEALEPLKVILAIYRSAKRNGARVEV
jgi:UDP-N-acetyl-2-amino-2-deoxyglucuronate dehydrogenase